MLFRISLCLTYFSFLAIQLSICGFPAAAGAFSGEKASCLARQLTYISTDEFFRQAFFEKNYDFFRNIFGKFFHGGKTPLPYTIYSMNARTHAYTADEKINDPAGKNGIAGKNYLQPPHVLQLPEHFLTGLPVAENISPDHSRRAAAPQTGQTTPSSNFFTNSSNCLPHSGQTYCKTGISHLRIR